MRNSANCLKYSTGELRVDMEEMKFKKKTLRVEVIILILCCLNAPVVMRGNYRTHKIGLVQGVAHVTDPLIAC